MADAPAAAELRPELANVGGSARGGGGPHRCRAGGRGAPAVADARRAPRRGSARHGRGGVAAVRARNVQTGVDAWLAARAVSRGGRCGRPAPSAGRARGDDRRRASSCPSDRGRATSPASTWRPGPDAAVRPCVRCGLYLVADGARTALLLQGAEPSSSDQRDGRDRRAPTRSRAARRPRDPRLALRHNVFRGQVLSFGGEMFGPGDAAAVSSPRSLRGRPGGADRDTLTASSAGRPGRPAPPRLLAAGQHLKRGLLLYGPPGVGKTHTVRYLMSSLTGTTVIELSGDALHLIAEACSVARALQPAMVVIEDVDLIAEDRGRHPGAAPAAVPAAQRDGRARRGRRRGLRAHHQPGRSAGAGVGRPARPGRPSGGARPARRDGAPERSSTSTAARSGRRRQPRRRWSPDRRGHGVVPQGTAAPGGAARRGPGRRTGSTGRIDGGPGRSPSTSCSTHATP